MGISVRELLLNDEFKDFKLIAGKDGLDREVQGLTFLEAPDGFKWSKGGELVCSSGYIISKYKNVIDEAFKDSSLLNTSGLIIKRGRFLDEIPDSMIEKFNEFNLPLIIMPFNIAWMELISKTNSVVMNRCISKFQIPLTRIHNKNFKDYKSRKINKVLSEIELSMDFPCALFDIENEEVYYSSSKFRGITSFYDLKNEQFINTTLTHTRHTICDYSQMARFRVIRDDDAGRPPVSWIRVPIWHHETIVAYLVVLEARRLIDNFDEIMIRLAYMNLTNLFESENEKERESSLSFEAIAEFALRCNEEDKKKLDDLMLSHGISSTKEYRLAILDCPDITVNSNQDFIEELLSASNLRHVIKYFVIDKNKFVLLALNDRIENSTLPFLDLLNTLSDQIKDSHSTSTFTIATCEDSATLKNLSKLFNKIERVLKLGSVFMPNRNVISYSDLGPLTWIDIPSIELEKMLKDFKDILESEKNAEILSTLKVYLANNMNYSITSEILRTHINTIRKRIDSAKELLDNDLQDPTERMKIIILLDFLDL